MSYYTSTITNIDAQIKKLQESIKTLKKQKEDMIKKIRLQEQQTGVKLLPDAKPRKPRMTAKEKKEVASSFLKESGIENANEFYDAMQAKLKKGKSSNS